MFNLKIQYKMAHDRNPMLALYADKLRVRDFVATRIGEEYLTKLYGTSEKPYTLERDSYPTEFVVKANHGSGACIIVWENAIKGNLRVKKGQDWRRVIVHPDELNWTFAQSVMNKWLKQNYYWGPGRLPEWAYKDIQPCILIEELLLGLDNQLPKDYKFYMFNGKCGLIQVDSNRFVSHTRDLFDTNWQLLPSTLGYPNSDEPPIRPVDLDKMIELSEKLSHGSDFIRVDLYQTQKGIKFGELTNYPEGGLAAFEPEFFNKKFGSSWNPRY